MNPNIVPRGRLIGLAVVGATTALAASMSGSAQAASSSSHDRSAAPARVAVTATVTATGDIGSGISTCTPAPGGAALVPPGDDAQLRAAAKAVESAARAAGTGGTISVSVGPDGVRVSGNGLGAAQRAALVKQLERIVASGGHRIGLTLSIVTGPKPGSGSAASGPSLISIGGTASASGAQVQSSGSGPANLPAPPPGAEGGLSVSSGSGPGHTVCGTPPAPGTARPHA